MKFLKSFIISVILFLTLSLADLSAQATAPLSATVIDTFTITVNSDIKLEEAIANGKFACYQDITEEQFKTDGQGEKKFQAKLLVFNRDVRCREVVVYADTSGCRPAKAIEVVEFSRRHLRELKNGSTVIAAGQTWVDVGDGKYLKVLAVINQPPKRHLSLIRFDDTWSNDNYFLVIKK